jgi:hypothetical protein
MSRGSRNRAGVAAVSAGLSLLGALPAWADPPPSAAPAAAVTPTEKAVNNLIEALVKKGALERSQGDELLHKFQADINASAAAGQTNGPGQGTASSAAPGSTAPAGSAAPPVVKVPYVPQIVQDQIRDEVKAAVVDQAKQEHWATPNSFPEWLNHIHPIGDLRIRDEARYFARDNYWAFVNVGAINAGAGYNVGPNNNVLPPILDSTHDRNYLRLRARAGFAVQADDAWSGVFRIASGSDPSPVSTYQTFGGAFDKKSLWLDQAFVKYEPWKGDALIAGRMPNPFDSTQLVWYQDINLDGIALTGRLPIGHTHSGIRTVVGAFPIEYVPDDFPTNATSDQKASQHANKWLFGGQLGYVWQGEPLLASLSGSFYDFMNVQGSLSPSCSNESAYCLTDYSRPGFMQKGNTLFALRNFTFPDPNDPSQPQYYGLASKFHVADVVGRLDARLSGNFHLILLADYARNIAYHANLIQQLPIVNNNETCSKPVPANQTCASAGGTSLFKSGNSGWFTRLTAGAPDPHQRWEWNAWFTYEYLQPDAVLDAFTDSDFHLGGTNAKGWIVGANLGVGLNTVLTARWFSTDVIYGPAFSEDTLQVDITMRF